MRWVSTKESSDARQPSWLAFAETGFAIALALFINSWLGGGAIAVLACAAPLSLLRTEASEKRGVRYGIAFTSALARLHSSTKLALNRGSTYRWSTTWVLWPLSIILLVACAAGLLCCRIAATAWGLIMHPLMTIGQIPKNWWRVTACTDTGHAPEPIPGYWKHADLAESDISKRVDSILQPWRYVVHGLGSQPTSRAGKTSEIIFRSISAPILIAISLTHRWTTKSVAILYLPLVWAATLGWSGDIEHQLRSIRESAASRIGRTVGFFVVAILLSRIVITPAWNRLFQILHCESAEQEAVRYSSAICQLLSPQAIPIWQIASAANGIAGIALFILADAQLRGGRTHENSYWLDPLLKWSSIVRATLSWYSVSIIVFTVAQSSIEIGDQWLPPGFSDWIKNLIG